MSRLILLWCLIGSWSGAGWAGAALTLQEAEALAVARDPLIRQHQARARALEEAAVAAAALPDPRLKLGVVNLPAWQPTLDREPMTQTVVGVGQSFPPAGQRRWRERQLRLQAEVARARARDRALEVLLALRRAWLDLYYLVEAAGVIEESEAVFGQLVKVTQYRYRAGLGTQHAVVRARLELALLQDRREAFVQRQETALAKVNRWLGELEGGREPRLILPRLPDPPERRAIEARLDEHPRVAAARAEVAAARAAVGVAKRERRPRWGMEVNYGLRAGRRADFLSAMVNVSLPLFPAHRQNRLIDARGHEVNAAKDQVAEVRRTLGARLEEEYARWARLDRRLDFYTREVLPEAARNSEVTRRAYQSRVSRFDELVRARLAELEANLTTLRLQVDRAKSYYGLRYLMGEEGP